MSTFQVGDTWREKGKRKRPVVVTRSPHAGLVEAVFADSRKAIRIAERTLLKYFTRDPR